MVTKQEGVALGLADMAPLIRDGHKLGITNIEFREVLGFGQDRIASILAGRSPWYASKDEQLKYAGLIAKKVGEWEMITKAMGFKRTSPRVMAIAQKHAKDAAGCGVLVT